MIIIKEYKNYILRTIDPEEGSEVYEIEALCFPSTVADNRNVFIERAKLSPDLFLVVCDKESGKIVGYLNGISTDEDKFRDEFFNDNTLYNPDGKNIMLLGMGILPEHRGNQLSRLLMESYLEREIKRGRNNLYLTCHENMIRPYTSMGYKLLGSSSSNLGGKIWYDMVGGTNITSI